jgi:hypothetical protein
MTYGPNASHLTGQMPRRSEPAAEVVFDQHWTLFNAARRQWLLATVVGLENGKAILRYDPGYGMKPPDNVSTIDVTSLLTTPMRFRLAE